VDGVSRTALAESADRLDALTRDLDADGLRRLSADLSAVTRLLVDEYALRRSLAETGLAADARAGLLDRLIGSRVSSEAKDLLVGVVRARWSGPADLVEAVGRLAALATLALAEHAGALDEVEDELFRFSRIIASDSRLSLALSSAALPVERKTALVQRLLVGKAREETVSLVEQALADTVGRTLDRRLETLIKLAAERRNRLVATVRVAVPPTSEQLQRLAEVLQATYGSAIQLQVELDPDVLGGVVVTVGGEILDGSVARRLEQARRAITR
jgi:F-type H+-transporting ATPase subunit delta